MAGSLLIAVVALLLYVTIPSSAPGAAEKQISKVYFADHISPAHRLVIDTFNKLYEGRIEVVPVDLPFDKFSTNERKELLARSLRSKSDRLDVFAVDLIWVPRFAKWSEPLDQYFPRERQESILHVALESCLYENNLVALPLYIDVGMLYYRRDLLQTLPDAKQIEARLKQSISWDELFQLRTRLGRGGKPFYVFQAKDYEGLVCNYLELIAQLDRSAISSTTFNLDRPAARIALQRLVDLVHKDRLSPIDVTEFDENTSYQYMLDNDAMFVRGWPNFIENFRKTYHDTSKIERIGRGALPHFVGHPPASVFGGWNIMISRYSNKKSEALEFVRFLQEKETQQMLFEAGGFIPTTTLVYDDSVYLARHSDLAYYRQLLTNGFHRPFHVEYTRISDIISFFVQAAIKRTITADDALRRATEMIRSGKVLIK